MKGEQRRGQHRLTAPIGGAAQQLAALTVGGVVQPAQQLPIVAPREDRRVVEAMVLNRDIGVVQPSRRVEVKLGSFTFTRFGLIGGEVASVSGDAIPDERRGLGYAARIRLDRENLHVNERETPLVPGMTATAEINTGERRVVDYPLSPLTRYSHVALREG